MKLVGLKLVGAFEIICALNGWYLMYRAFTGEMSYEPVPALWFGIFPLLSLIAGIALLFNMTHGVRLSIIVLALQIPLIFINGVTILRVGIAFNLYLTAFWNARSPGGEPTVLGINALAIAMLVVLLVCRPAAKSVAIDSHEESNPLSA